MTRKQSPKPSITFEFERWNPPNPKKHPVSSFDALDFDYRLLPVALYWEDNGKKFKFGHGGLLGLAENFYRWRCGKPRARVLELPELEGDGVMLRVERGAHATSIVVDGNTRETLHAETEAFDAAIDKFISSARLRSAELLPGGLDHPVVKKWFANWKDN